MNWKLVFMMSLFFLQFDIVAQDSLFPIPAASPEDLQLVGLQKFIGDFTLPKVDVDPFKKFGLSSDAASIDSLKSWKRFIPPFDGQISVTYEAGQLPNFFLPDHLQPLHVFQTQGMLNTTAFSLPMRVSWRYATLKNPIGINNYFRFSFDTEKFKQTPNLQQGVVKDKVSKQLQDLEAKKGMLNGKLGYAEVLREQAKLKLQRTLEEQKAKYLDLEKFQNSYPPDSLCQQLSTTEKTDSLTKSCHEKQEKLQKMREDYAMCATRIEKLQKQIDTLQYFVNQITKYRNSVDSIGENLQKKQAQYLAFSKDLISKQAKGLGMFKKLDFGLTYPKTTALSKNVVPLKGFDIEVEKNNWYYALCAGITMNNLMVTNNVVQNTLNQGLNLFNQFDFQSIQKQRLLTFAKFGYGKKEATHAHIGVRYTNQGIVQGFTSDTNALSSPAAGIELDLRWVPKFYKGGAWDLVYGKTSRQQQAQDSIVNRNPFSSLFSTDRTNAALLRYTQNLSKLRTQVIATSRFLDANADLTSMGVLQPNNARFELQTRHHLMANTNLGLSFRLDRNNVDAKEDTTREVQMFGCNTSTILFDKLQINGQVSLLRQNSRTTIAIPTVSNYMGSFSAMMPFKLWDLKHQVSAQVMSMSINTQKGLTQLNHIGFEQGTKLNKGKNSFSINFMSAVIPEQVGQQRTVLIQDLFQWQQSKWDWSAAFKLAFSDQFGVQPGGFVAATYSGFKDMTFSGKVEKLVLGDFYSTYNQDRFQRFPFFLQFQFTYQFKKP